MRRVRPILLIAGALLFAGCDDTPATSTTAADTTTVTSAAGGVRFTGNSTCSIANQRPYTPQPPATHGPPVGEAVAEMPHYHVASTVRVTYAHDPPTSGCHYNLGLGQAPVNAGVYDQEVLAERWVHNLEHGYIVVLYNCRDSPCADAVSALTRWFQSLPPDPQAATAYPKVVVMPWSSMPAHFACVSWDWYLGMSQLDIPTVDAFYRNHLDEAPEGNASA